MGEGPEAGPVLPGREGPGPPEPGRVQARPDPGAVRPDLPRGRDRGPRRLPGRVVPRGRGDGRADGAGGGGGAAARAFARGQAALALARKALRPGGSLVVKSFQGEGYRGFLREVSAHFESVKGYVPPATSRGSSETYVVATGKLD